jgi:hypothetical protein
MKSIIPETRTEPLTAEQCLTLLEILSAEEDDALMQLQDPDDMFDLTFEIIGHPRHNALVQRARERQTHAG